MGRTATLHVNNLLKIPVHSDQPDPIPEGAHLITCGSLLITPMIREQSITIIGHKTNSNVVIITFIIPQMELDFFPP